MQPTKRFHYAWIVIGVTFFAPMAGMGVRSNFGVYIKPVEAEFHTTRESVSRINFLSLLVFAFMQPVIGAIVDRYGPRVILAGSMLLAGLGTIGLAYAPSLLWVGVLYTVAGGSAFVSAEPLHLESDRKGSPRSLGVPKDFSSHG